ncbi:MAG: hypothetical protein N3A57_02990 [Negativicutes bacterium]|nr:hypothetical protein [Negativicutes bacterium]
MATMLVPVANGVLPRPNGGRIIGAFAGDTPYPVMKNLIPGGDIVLCPWVAAEGRLFPVGVLTRVVRVWEAEGQDEQGGSVPLLMAQLEGVAHGRWHRPYNQRGVIWAASVEQVSFAAVRHNYPVISGAGWMPEGGYTEFRSQWDLPVTIYGYDLMDGSPLKISGNLGRLVSQEQAHTIEHAIIRALTTYGLCTAKTLAAALAAETDELKHSLELGFRFALPEVLGQTSTGACGNQMTQLAQLYMHQEIIDSIDRGQSLPQAVGNARRRTMSQLTSQLGLTSRAGLRVLQGLKKGMSHDDTPIKLEVGKRIIKRFPLSPWQ